MKNILKISSTILLLFFVFFKSTVNKDNYLNSSITISTVHALSVDQNLVPADDACYAGVTSWLWGQRVPTCTAGCPIVRLKQRVETGTCTI